MIVESKNRASRKYPDLKGVLKSQWEAVTASYNRDLITYRPCQIQLNNGEILDAVYVIGVQEYLNVWGIWLDLDYEKRQVDLAKVVKISESPLRLPPEIANKIYAAGESGMGYHVFTLVFRDGSNQPVRCGNAVDFVKLHQDKTMTDIVDVLPHKGLDEATAEATIDYYWCLFEERT